MMHPSTFKYLAPTENQLHTMEMLRSTTADYAANLEDNIPDGPDKTYIMRKLRELAMWINVAITRNPDGSPRSE